jgi:hypothetical protein
MSWSSVLVSGLKLILVFTEYLNNRQLLTAGQDKAVAEASVRVLEATKHGKHLREMIRGLSDEESKSLWEDMLDV